MKTILVVDDDDDLRELMVHVLVHAGYAVQEARNGQEALIELERSTQPPSLVLLDLMMPVMSGVQFLEAVRANKAAPVAPIVVLSAIADRHTPPGALAYLQKPVSPDALLKVVADSCSR